MRRELVSVVIAASACFAALSGCRGVLGIEDLDVVADSSSGDGSVGVDARVDAPSDASSGADTSTLACKDQTDCPRCCHESLATKAGFPKLVALAKQSGCICGSGACTQECGSSLCADTSAAFDPPCGQCVDAAIKKMAGPGACDTAKMQCGPDRTCKDYLDCLISCK